MEFIKHLTDEKRLSLNTVATDRAITYNDPCNVSRLNESFNDALAFAGLLTVNRLISL